MLAVSATATASQVKTQAVDVAYQFDACDAQWQVRHNVELGVISLDKKNPDTGVYQWTVNRAYDTIVKNLETPYEFMDIFITQANNKLSAYCGDSGGGPVPTDWEELISYIIKNEISYDPNSNTVSRN